MKINKTLSVIVVIVLAVVLAVAQAVTGPKLSEVQQLKMDNLRLQRIALQQNMQLLQQNYATAQQQLQSVDVQAKELGESIIKEQKLKGYTFDSSNFTFTAPATPAPKLPEVATPVPVKSDK